MFKKNNYLKKLNLRNQMILCRPKLGSTYPIHTCSLIQLVNTMDEVHRFCCFWCNSVSSRQNESHFGTFGVDGSAVTSEVLIYYPLPINCYLLSFIYYILSTISVFTTLKRYFDFMNFKGDVLKDFY